MKTQRQVLTFVFSFLYLCVNAHATTHFVKCDIDVGLGDWHIYEPNHVFKFTEETYLGPISFMKPDEEILFATDAVELDDGKGSLKLKAHLYFADLFDFPGPDHQFLARKQAVKFEFDVEVPQQGSFHRDEPPAVNTKEWGFIQFGGQPGTIDASQLNGVLWETFFINHRYLKLLNCTTASEP